MTGPTGARETEAEALAAAYQIALAQIGVDTVADAISLWQSVPTTARAATAEHWLASALASMLAHRSRAVALGLAFYRLNRALLTGRTITHPLIDDERKHVTLGELREQFNELAHSAPKGADSGSGTESNGSSSQRPAGGQQSASSSDVSTADGDEDVPIDDVDWGDWVSESDRDAEDELNTLLPVLGTDNLAKKVGAIDDSKPAKDVDKERQAAHDAAGARQAATGARVAMNGARGATWQAQESDEAAIGWARVSTTGTPCGWCAMLISRGPVYRSKKSAETVDYVDGDKYHDNCHCIAVPVYKGDFYDRSSQFDLNRKYADLWPKVTQGLGGKDAVSAWRRFIRKEQEAK